MLAALKQLAKKILPASVRFELRRRLVRYSEFPPYRCVRFGSLRRVSPIHRGFGVGRGKCVDRYYIEKFLADHANDISGHVLEFGDDTYTRTFGGTNVHTADVIDVRQGWPNATIVADLTAADHIPSNTFDCIICTQVLPFIYDLNTAVRTLHRLLKPSGVLLATLPGFSQIASEEMDYCGDFWRFTSASAKRLIDRNFAAEELTVETFGNVLAIIAFLHGLAAEELRTEELDFHDPEYQFVVALRAVKRGAPKADS